VARVRLPVDVEPKLWWRARIAASNDRPGKERIEEALKRELERLRERGDLLADEKALPEPSNSKLPRELENQAA
jgi:hypothetical protein